MTTSATLNSYGFILRLRSANRGMYPVLGEVTMDTVLLLTGAGVIVAAAGVAATVVIWALKGVFNLGGLHMKVDALNERVDVVNERIDDLSRKVDNLAEGQQAVHADLNRVINMLTALANHRHDVDGNTIFNLPPNA